MAGITMDVPQIIDYGHADPLGQRLKRSVPRLRWRSWLLIGLMLLLWADFVHEVPVWQGRELAPRAYYLDRGQGPAITVLPGDQRCVRVQDSGLEMIDLPSGKRTFFSEGQGYANVVSKDGRRLLSGDGLRLRLFDPTSLKRIAEIALAGGERGQDHATISVDGTRLVVWTPDGVQLWDAQAGKKIVDLPPHFEYAGDEIGGVRITDDQRFAVALRYERLDFYRLADGAFDHGFRLPSYGWRDGVSFSRDGSATAAVGVFDGNLHIFDAAGADRVPPLPFGSQMNGVNIYQIETTDDGKRIVLAGNGKLTLVDAVAGRVMQSAPLPWNGGVAFPFELSPDGRWIAFPDAPAGSLIFDARTLKRPSALANGYCPSPRAFSPDGHWFVSIDPGSQALKVWDTRTWKPLSSIPPDPTLQYVWYLADGSILSGGSDGSMKLWTRHRPEAWYGFAALPIFWVALAATIAAFRGVRKDVWRWRHPWSHES
jgi:WD40 repeat protein